LTDDALPFVHAKKNFSLADCKIKLNMQIE